MKKLLLLILLIPNLVMAENVIYCQDELATGYFKNENGVWKTSDFKLERHTIKFNDDYTYLRAYPLTQCLALNHIITYLTILLVYIQWVVMKLFHTINLLNAFCIQISLRGGMLKSGPDTESLSAGSCEAF